MAIRKRISGKLTTAGQAPKTPEVSAPARPTEPSALTKPFRVAKALKAPPPPKSLQAWYTSEDAKRGLGFICSSVDEQNEIVGVMGSPGEPQLKLMGVDLYDGEIDEVIALEEARAHWAHVTMAVALLGTRFRIDGRKQPRAVLIANPAAPHPALRFRRPQTPEIKAMADRLEDVLNEIRRLNNRGDPVLPVGLYELADRLDRSSDLIDRRFREVWRDRNFQQMAM